jgi:hypothetical protein
MPVATWNDSAFTWDSGLLDWNGNFTGTPTVETNFKTASYAASSQAIIRVPTVAVVGPFTVATYHE